MTAKMHAFGEISSSSRQHDLLAFLQAFYNIIGQGILSVKSVLRALGSCPLRDIVVVPPELALGSESG